MGAPRCRLQALRQWAAALGAARRHVALIRALVSGVLLGPNPLSPPRALRLPQDPDLTSGRAGGCCVTDWAMAGEEAAGAEALWWL